MGSITPSPDFSPFFAPWTTDTLLELRTGKTTVVPGTAIPSAINKRTRSGPLYVAKLGIDGDQQTFFKHGGPDKAVLQYCSAHYPMWTLELPDSADHFKLGRFGENFVAAKMNERNVCIGDVIQVGDEVRLQVSLPRAPCYKLNHQFQNQDMSRLCQESSRTGWYYRVLREGYVKPGDELRLVERRHEKWTVHMVQEYLHRDKKNEEAVRELAELPELGEDFRELFQNRLQKMSKGLGPESEEGRLRGADEDRLETRTGWRRGRSSLLRGRAGRRPRSRRLSLRRWSRCRSRRRSGPARTSASSCRTWSVPTRSLVAMPIFLRLALRWTTTAAVAPGIYTTKSMSEIPSPSAASLRAFRLKRKPASMFSLLVVSESQHSSPQPGSLQRSALTGSFTSAFDPKTTCHSAAT